MHRLPPLELFQRIACTRLGREGKIERVDVEPRVAPGDVRVVDCVRHAEIAESAELPARDPVGNSTLEDQVFLA